MCLFWFLICPVEGRGTTHMLLHLTVTVFSKKTSVACLELDCKSPVSVESTYITWHFPTRLVFFPCPNMIVGFGFIFYFSVKLHWELPTCMFWADNFCHSFGDGRGNNSSQESVQALQHYTHHLVLLPLLFLDTESGCICQRHLAFWDWHR